MKLISFDDVIDENGQPDAEWIVVAFSRIEHAVCANTMLQLLQDFPGRRFEAQIGKAPEMVRALHKALRGAKSGRGEAAAGIRRHRLSAKQRRDANIVRVSENSILLEISKQAFQTLAELVRDGATRLDEEYATIVGVSPAEGAEIAAEMDAILRALSASRSL
ncbi:hypothetical protein ACH0CG_01915 [Microbacterium sp. 179-I 1D1 NHS]|uniref:hypothetical protein n=1 Tax=Microbacterium sp. 179-I 1D1 NHS TaxID=3374298 RepID=UPI003879947D